MDFFLCIVSINIFSLQYDFLNHTSFSLAYFVIRIKSTIRIIHKICVDQLCMFWKGFLVNSKLNKLTVVKFWGGIFNGLGSVLLTPALLKGQLYSERICFVVKSQ